MKQLFWQAQNVLLPFTLSGLTCCSLLAARCAAFGLFVCACTYAARHSHFCGPLAHETHACVHTVRTKCTQHLSRHIHSSVCICIVYVYLRVYVLNLLPLVLSNQFFSSTKNKKQQQKQEKISVHGIKISCAFICPESE